MPIHEAVDSSSPRILLAEDQGILALATARRIRRYGYEVDIAGSGKDVLECVETATERSGSYDLILMDIDLGAGIDGVETAQRIPQEVRPPIVFLTNHSDEATFAKARALNPYGYILKGVGEMQLRLSIETALDLYLADQNSRANEKDLETLCHAVPVSLLLVDAEFRVLKANQRVMELAEAKVEPLPGSLVGAVIRCVNGVDDPSACGMSAACETCALRNAIRVTIRDRREQHNVEARLVVRRDGRNVPMRCRLSTAPIGEPPDAKAIISIIEADYE